MTDPNMSMYCFISLLLGLITGYLIQHLKYSSAISEITGILFKQQQEINELKKEIKNK